MTEKETPTEEGVDYNALFEEAESPEMAKADTDAPTWIKVLDEEHYLVKTRSGIYKLKELEWGRVERARKRAGDKGNPNEFILADSIVGHDGKKAKYGELDIRGWKGSTVMRLATALTIIYGVDDFLGQ